MENYTFRETQFLPMGWKIILAIGLILGIYSLFHLYQKDQLNIYNVSAILITALILIPLFFAKLILVLDEGSIQIKYVPFHFSFISYNRKDIESISIERYDPLSDFGGWGIKYNYCTKRKIFSVSGSTAMVIKMKNGKERWIGVQNKERLTDFLNKYYHDKFTRTD